MPTTTMPPYKRNFVGCSSAITVVHTMLLPVTGKVQKEWKCQQQSGSTPSSLSSQHWFLVQGRAVRSRKQRRNQEEILPRESVEAGIPWLCSQGGMAQASLSGSADCTDIRENQWDSLWSEALPASDARKYNTRRSLVRNWLLFSLEELGEDKLSGKDGLVCWRTALKKPQRS
ncbi:uncharacterized protein LOC135298834 isoform X3 [Passer domesticus]|uniref:uncharacterized protein LOC135298834 isoform X3 n=1 Tax=Passer domesticus TaxID=48849 RepID=UPI0030FF0C66